jgi:hypothetical protein
LPRHCPFIARQVNLLGEELGETLFNPKSDGLTKAERNKSFSFKNKPPHLAMRG